MLDSKAWATMKPSPRALYLELKRLFNGSNNGKLFLSHRDAAKRLNVGRDTVAGYYDELTKRGFIVQTRGHCLGPSGVGQAATYALTESPLNNAPATKEFMRWKKQNPRRKIQHPMAGKSNAPCRKNQPLSNQMSENPTASGQNSPITVSENPAIYTSNHIPCVKERFRLATLGVEKGLGLCGKAKTQVAA
jgi:DNA-binding transcriptional MocR family regulator